MLQLSCQCDRMLAAWQAYYMGRTTKNHGLRLQEKQWSRSQQGDGQSRGGGCSNKTMRSDYSCWDKKGKALFDFSSERSIHGYPQTEPYPRVHSGRQSQGAATSCAIVVALMSFSTHKNMGSSLSTPYSLTSRRSSATAAELRYKRLHEARKITLCHLWLQRHTRHIYACAICIRGKRY